ncbi:hypothetical protein CA54_42200 [Symmachiella macrocystis]|uniref:Uncharacterized protein n=1 Tax=Symmachiella macrocystis TaxID=2527985 RepID=A0A5C6BAG7_9PLAN|nr:hypothetical protein [Symmachiella macrocystis]TWU08980.1 hypothetical protein CA54_42200 [Symmachiella macrocystis]
MLVSQRDLFHHNEVTYSVAATSNGDVFDVEVFDIPILAYITGCVRGYVAEYATLDERLILNTLFVSPVRSNHSAPYGFEAIDGPPIDGVAPSPPPDGESSNFHNCYQDLNVHLEYSGGVLLTREWIDYDAAQLGYNDASWRIDVDYSDLNDDAVASWSLEAFELVFESGELIGAYDRSDPVAEIQERIRRLPSIEKPALKRFKRQLRKFVKSSFKHKYGLGYSWVKSLSWPYS